jgi:hypothetical protein
LDKVTIILTYLLLTSVAAERLVDILKRTLPFLNRMNSVIYQLLSGVFGGLICYYTPPDISFLNVNQYVLIVITALAVSGGSSVWNNILQLLTEYRKSIGNLSQQSKGGEVQS